MVYLGNWLRILVILGCNVTFAFGSESDVGSSRSYLNDEYRYSVQVPRPYSINRSEYGSHGFTVHLDKADVADIVVFAGYDLGTDPSDPLGAGTNLNLKTACPVDWRISITPPKRTEMKGLPVETVSGVCAGPLKTPDFAFDVVTVSRTFNGSVVIYGFTLVSALKRADLDRTVFHTLLRSLRFLPAP